MFEYWVNICETCDWDEEKIKENYNMSLLELRSIFFVEPLKVIKLHKKALTFIGGEKYAYLIKKYQKLLENYYVNKRVRLTFSLDEIISIIQKAFNNFEFEQLVALCSNCDWNTDKIKMELENIRKDGIEYNLEILKRELLKNPRQVMDLDKEALNFLFSAKNAEILFTYKRFIIYQIQENPDFKFDIKNIKHDLIEIFHIWMQKCKYDENLFKKRCARLKIGIKDLELLGLKRELNKLVQKQIDFSDTSISENYKILEKLLNAEKESDIIKIIDDSGITSYELKRAIYDFLRVYHYNEYDQLKVSLTNKINLYLQIKNKERQTKEKLKKEKDKLEKMKLSLENNLDSAKELIKSFVNSDCLTKEEFCFQNNITIDEFNFNVEIVKIGDNTLYDIYVNKMENVRDKKYAVLVSIVEKVFNLIKTGILEEDKIRPFDLLDYYQLTSMTRTDFLRLIKEIYKSNLGNQRIAIKFLRKYENSELLTQSDINSILKTNNVVNVEFDANNKPIPNTGRIITKEEKQAIIDYLSENNIPLYDDCYNIAYKRYINGTLFNENEKQNNLK